jgi:hypothetical protein
VDDRRASDDAPEQAEPRPPRRIERLYLALAIVTYGIALICVLLAVGRHLRGMPIRPEVFPAAALFALAGTGLLFISTHRARRRGP